MTEFTREMIEEITGLSLPEVLAWALSLGLDAEIVSDFYDGDYVRVSDELGSDFRFYADEWGCFDGFVEDMTYED